MNRFLQNPEHTFENETGIFEVSLIVTDNLGCTDTTFKHIWIADEYWMYVPNSFTPDNDQINDRFCISFNGIRTETFSFNVYNRVSEVVYSTTNIIDLECFLNNNGWDGLIKKLVKICRWECTFTNYIFRIMKDGNIRILETSTS